MPVRYDKPGQYVAICNKTNFDGHYIKVFEYPQAWKDEWEQYCKTILQELRPIPDAAWYFLNRVDGVACIEAVYPIEIFQNSMLGEIMRINKEEALRNLKGVSTNHDGHDI